MYIIVTPPLIIAQLTNNTSHPQCQNYSTWLAEWTSHLENSLGSIKVPTEATAITTPLQPKEWQGLLREHPDKPLTKYFIAGLNNSFKVGFSNPPSKLPLAQKNQLGLGSPSTPPGGGQLSQSRDC